MSEVVKCDGPGCQVTKDPDYDERAICEVGWTHVEQLGREFDFHDPDCLVKWGGGTPRSLSELRAAWDNPPDNGRATLSRINIRLVSEWPALCTAINRLLGT